MAKRKYFTCQCGAQTSKTVPNYYAQVKRLGYALCTTCAIKRNAENTSKRLRLIYADKPKNRDIIISKCIDCGKPRKIQRRTLRDKYTRCKSCAAKANYQINIKTYHKAAEARSNNPAFSNKISQGMLAIPDEIRSERSRAANGVRWVNTKAERLAVFIEKAKEIHKDTYDYSLVEYVNYITPIIIICPKHGQFTQTPKNHACDGYGCRRCSELRVISTSHSEIADYITSIITTTIEHNFRSVIPPYEVDIWLPNESMAIEHHGIYWHSFNAPESPKEKKLHKRKADLSERAGIILLQIFETEWIQKRDIIKSILAAKLGATNRIYARKCFIGTPSISEYTEFMNRNHLQGHRRSSYRIGLYDSTDTLQTAIGISRHSTESYELIRYATKQGNTIVGGLSRLLKKAKNDLRMTRLMTFADRRYSIGKGYLTCGFEFVENTKPNYFYTTGDKNQPLIKRQAYQKHKLSKKLADFHQEYSESQNMFLNGWRRIWDAGHMKLVKIWK